MLTRKPVVLCQVVLHEGQRGLYVGLNQLFLHASAQSPRHGAHEKWHGLAWDGVKHQLHHQPVHQRAFGVVHPETALAMRGRAACGLQVRQLGRRLRTVALGQIFQNGARLGHHQLPIGNDGRFAQRMDVFQLGRGQPRERVALVAAQFVGHTKLLQEPQNTVRARSLKVVQGQHGGEGGEGGKGVEPAWRSQRIKRPSTGSFS